MLAPLAWASCNRAIWSSGSYVTTRLLTLEMTKYMWILPPFPCRGWLACIAASYRIYPDCTAALRMCVAWRDNEYHFILQTHHNEVNLL